MKNALFLIYLFSSSVSALELQKYPIVLESPLGEQVTIVENADKTQALVKVIGVNHPIDEVVFLTDLLPHGSIQAYKYTYDGQQRALLTREQGYSCCSYSLYLPDTSKAIYLSELKDKRNKAISEDTYAQYKMQLDKGVQSKLALFNRERAIENLASALTDADEALAKHCGKEIKTKVNWHELDNSTLQTYAVGAYCAQVANVLVKQCQNSALFKSKIKPFKSVDCTFSDELKLRHTQNTINFKTAPKEPNQIEFVEAYFRNL